MCHSVIYSFLLSIYHYAAILIIVFLLFSKEGSDEASNAYSTNDDI